MTGNRLVYVLPKPDFFTEGGRGRVTHALGICEGFIENGWDVTVVSGPGIDQHWFCPEGVTGVSVPETVDRARELGPVGQLAWMWRFHRMLRGRIDQEDRCHVLVRYSLRWLPWLGRLGRLLNRWAIPSALEVNSFGYHRTVGKLPGVASRAFLEMEIAVAAQYDFTYVVSPELETLLRSRDFPSRVVTVPNGVSSRLVSRAEPSRDVECGGATPCRCVYFGTLHSYYDFEILLNGYERLRLQRSDIELHVHGSGREEDRIRKFARDVGDVHLHGRYELTDLLEWLDPDRDILVLPPKEEYDVSLSGGLSTKVFEYMATGLPLVASDQLEAILEHGENALLYPADDAVGLARQIARVADNPELARRMGRNVRSTVLREHTWRRRCERLIETYRSQKAADAGDGPRPQSRAG